MAPFKEKLKILRLTKKLTQDELAAVLGLAKSTISMYENGNREPVLKTLEALATFFNVDMNVLLDWKDGILELNEDDMYLVNVKRKLPPEDMAVVKAVVDTLYEKTLKNGK